MCKSQQRVKQEVTKAINSRSSRLPSDYGMNYHLPHNLNSFNDLFENVVLKMKCLYLMTWQIVNVTSFYVKERQFATIHQRCHANIGEKTRKNAFCSSFHLFEKLLSLFHAVWQKSNTSSANSMSVISMTEFFCSWLSRGWSLSLAHRSLLFSWHSLERWWNKGFESVSF